MCKQFSRCEDTKFFRDGYYSGRDKARTRNSPADERQRGGKRPVWQTRKMSGIK